MPWANPDRCPLTKEFIGTIPPVPGVYALCLGREFIYIGDTENLQRKLLDHLDEKSECISRMNPDTFSFEPVPDPERVARRNRLILELNPVCNQKMG